MPAGTEAPTATATPSPTPTQPPTATATPTATSPPATAPPPAALARTSFSLPGDAAANNGGSIGPFCCRGRTVTIVDTSGSIVGYAYWFQWAGQAYDTTHNGAFDSMYPDIRVLVDDVAGGQSSIDFSAGELVPGATRTRAVGRLEFTVTISSAQQTGVRRGIYAWGSR